MDEKQQLDPKPDTPQAQNRGPVRKWLSKRWVYPAMYLGAAAVVIGVIYARIENNSTPTSVTTTETNQTSQTGTTSNGLQPWVWPYAQGTDATVTMGFFPVHGSMKQQAAAVVEYDNTFYPHKGIDIRAAGGRQFTVVSAQRGTVESVTNQPLYGYEVVVSSPDGYTETYQSLGSVDVKPGESIAAGDTIGTTSTNLFEQNQGNHLYFQVNQNGQPVDPQSLLPKQ
ncbi:M23 family metallopeptidase [Alicyclobacillus mali]|uniref:M23 family metallopeptidase n=1 Tax=Alicyclobacillus mali (ex Roth et al. 2021) TaxID=1123961 RepID=A0ABS0F0Y2_9BACL|nr:M23 family metallopeptidase [Alicyclobacillus mali (ex Roth et al. 2021)]MBF8376925.1 M23 family metallopeptidase [Alicyclobacillus mali (ex Roth et al. 2021)]